MELGFQSRHDQLRSLPSKPHDAIHAASPLGLFLCHSKP